MIFSTDHNILILSPQKTGTMMRLAYYRDINFFKKTRKYAHITLKEFEDSNLNKENITKFCFVRNPWDRVCSMFHMKFKNESINYRKKNFKKYIMEYNLIPMNKFYQKNGKLAVDFLMQSEKLKESIEYINKKINYPSQKIKIEKTIYDVNYKNWIDDEILNFVAKKEKETLNLIDYQFS